MPEPSSLCKQRLHRVGHDKPRCRKVESLFSKTFISLSTRPMPKENFYDLGNYDALQRHIKIERDKAKKLRKSPWWKTQIQQGLCHFCQQMVGADHITMDHLVPLARGGKSTRGNIVPACQVCNKKKQLGTPVETLLDQIRAQKG